MIWLALASSALAFETSGSDHLELKWVRDSAEYALLTEQIYGGATRAVQQAAEGRRKRDRWAVVLDIDETTLNTSVYWLELAAYGRVFDWPSWNAWVERRDAPTVPGVVGFVEAVRDAGGRVAWISNRHDSTRQATVDNLAAHGLWDEADTLCLLTDDEAYTKGVRRAELREGRAPCGWDEPVEVLAYLGDSLGDLPTVEEGGPREASLGVRDFVLPNPMYGGWEHEVTAPR